jgi:hypothetical protein
LDAHRWVPFHDNPAWYDFGDLMSLLPRWRQRGAVEASLESNCLVEVPKHMEKDGLLQRNFLEPIVSNRTDY